MSNKNKITFLDLVIPFCVAYIVMSLLYTHIRPMSENSFLDVFVICLLAFFIMYGLCSFVRDWLIIGKRILIKYTDKMKRLFLVLACVAFVSATPKPPTLLCQSADYTITKNHGIYRVVHNGVSKRYLTSSDNEIPPQVVTALNACNNQNN